MKKLGLGIQDFAAFTAENLIYVDKTELIHRQAFPNTEASSNVWSGSPGAGNSDYAWGVNFNYGFSVIDNRAYDNAVRLVRGGQ